MKGIKFQYRDSESINQLRCEDWNWFKATEWIILMSLQFGRFSIDILAKYYLWSYFHQHGGLSDSINLQQKKGKGALHDFPLYLGDQLFSPWK